MTKQQGSLNSEVTRFLDGLAHPFRKEIEQLRMLILSAQGGLTENIKWNAPNYCLNGEDRITMRIQPPGQVQLIFHRGAKVQAPLKDKLINDDTGLLSWKGTDRAVATFKNSEDIERYSAALAAIVRAWLDVASEKETPAG